VGQLLSPTNAITSSLLGGEICQVWASPVAKIENKKSAISRSILGVEKNFKLHKYQGR
jgi:hypothetical protein